MKPNVSILSYKKFVVDASGLHVQGQPDYAEWMEYGQMLHAVNQHLQMVIGDWLNYGEKRYGETYTQATAMWPELQQGTLANWKYVAGSVKSSLRSEDLHFSHYAVVAPLPPAEQRQWLKRAKAEKLTSRELRKIITGKAEIGLADLLDAEADRIGELRQRPDAEPCAEQLEAAQVLLRTARLKLIEPEMETA